MQSIAVVTPGVEKRAALMFDKVFLIDFKLHPQALITRQKNPDWLDGATFVPDFDLSFINEQQEGELFEALGKVAEALLAVREGNYDVVPVYKRAAIQDGQTKAYIAGLEMIPVVIEEHLSYEQVAEFRRDHEACGNYRALRTWLRDGLGARSTEEARELIERKIEDYTNSIQKHGLETARDYIQIVYDDKFIKRLLALTSGAAVLVSES